MLEPSRNRSHPSLRTRRDDTHSVKGEELRNLRCVCAELVVGPPQRCPFFAGGFQLQDSQRKSVHKQDDVWTPSTLISFDRELINGQKLISVWLLEVQQPCDLVTGLAACVSAFYRNASRK
jgi:hypothetical protein